MGSRTRQAAFLDFAPVFRKGSIFKLIASSPEPLEPGVLPTQEPQGFVITGGGLHVPAGVVHGWQRKEGKGLRHHAAFVKGWGGEILQKAPRMRTSHRPCTQKPLAGGWDSKQPGQEWRLPLTQTYHPASNTLGYIPNNLNIKNTQERLYMIPEAQEVLLPLQRRMSGG